MLSKRIKIMQKTIVAETTALAGSTTESLRNIELVKSLGLAHQEVGRLNGITAKILKLELKKVKYLRSLSFIQGTAVNTLRTSILFFMLYLIFRQEIQIGQFFALMIYSFFIFTPLQELGNVINIYRETEVSLQNFQQILDTPRDPKPSDPQSVDELVTLSLNASVFSIKALLVWLSTESASARLAEIRSRSSGRRGRGSQPSSNFWWVCTLRKSARFSTTGFRRIASISTCSVKKLDS